MRRAAHLLLRRAALALVGGPRPLCVSPFRGRRAAADRLAGLVGRPLRPRGPRPSLRAARSRSRVVPLVPCDGRAHLSRSEGSLHRGRFVHRGEGRPGQPARSGRALQGLWLARHHHVRARRRRKGQAGRLLRRPAFRRHPSRRAGNAGEERGADFGRDRNRQPPARRAPRRLRAGFRRQLRQDERRLGSRLQVRRRELDGLFPRPRLRRRCRGRAPCQGHARPRAAADRSGRRRLLPIFRRGRLALAAFREDRDDPGDQSATLCRGIEPVERSALSSGRRRHLSLSDRHAGGARRLLLCQPGRRPQSGYRRPSLLRHG